jgi:hypothetical protein
MSRFFKRANLLTWILTAALALPTLAHMIAGLSSRMMADDYCFASVILKNGLWGAQVYWYRNWTGGYGSVFTQDVAAMLGSWVYPLLPLLLLVLWFIALLWMLYWLGRLVQLESSLASTAALAALILYATVEGNPNTIQSVYWASASLSYTAPLVILTFYAGLVLYALQHPTHRWGNAQYVVYAAGLTFLAGGCSETFMALQVSLLELAAVALVFVPTDSRRAILPIVGAGLVGAGVSVVTTVLSLGNAIRQAHFPPPPALGDLIDLTMTNAGQMIALQIQQYVSIPLLVALVAAGWLGFKASPTAFRLKPRWLMRILLLLGGIVFSLMAVCVMPAAYAMIAMPPRHAFIVPQFVLVIATVLAGG